MLLTKLDKAPDVLQQSINLGISLLSGETVELQRSFYHHLASCSKNHNFMKVCEESSEICFFWRRTNIRFYLSAASSQEKSLMECSSLLDINNRLN
jgi:hypothetical protein